MPIETELNGLPNLVVMRSVSLYGLSNIRVTFADGTDLYFARQQVFERLAGAGLPDGVSPEVEAPFSPSGLVYRYVLQSSDRSAMDLHVLQDWVLDKAYRAVPGVADVASLGGETMQYQVLVDPTKLAGAGLSISDMSAALGANNSNGGGGFISEGGQFFYVRGLGRVVTLEDIGNIVLTVKNSVPVLVKDVATVEIGHAPRLGQFGFNKTDDAVEGVDSHAHRRTGAGGIEARRGEDARVERSRVAEGREGRSVLRPPRSRRPHDAHGAAQSRHRHRARGDRARVLSIRPPLGTDRRRNGSVWRCSLPSSRSTSGTSRRTCFPLEQSILVFW